jgi:hypothetical protein
MQDTTTKGNDRDGVQSNALLPRRFRSSARWRTPAVRVGLPTSHVATTSDACCPACWTGIPTVRISDVTVTDASRLRAAVDAVPSPREQAAVSK